MKKCSLILMMVFCVVGLAFSQRTITGMVIDDLGDALIGANVLVKGTTIGTVTDIEGKYTLSVPEGSDMLVFSYTGYATRELAMGATNVMDITMAEGALLGEVVVTAAGLERNARDVVYANQTVSGDDLLSTPNKSTLEALRGKTAGVRLSTGSGSVGASTKIVLRGEGSLTGDNNALIVIDGIPIDNGSTSAGAGASTTGYADHGNRFNDINPDDIESLTILKGPSATSLYGSRGASGVVLITTKKGGNGKDGTMQVGFNTSFSVENAYVLLQRQDQFGQGFDNASFDSGENWSWGPAFDGVVRPWTSPIDSDGDFALESLVRPYSAVPNQLEEFFNTGHTLTNSFSLSGANNGFTYYASYSNTDQDGILDNTDYKRNTFTVNATAKLSDRLSSNFKVSYANTKQNTAQEGSRAFEGNNAYSMAIQSPVNIPFGELRDYNSPFHDINGYWGSYSSVNPYYILNEYGNGANINNVLGNASITYNVAEGLDFVGRFGVNVVNTNIETFSPTFAPDLQLVWGNDLSLTTRDSRHSSLGDYTRFSQQNTNLDFTGLANYNRQLSDDFTLDASLGFNWFQTQQNSLTGSTQGGLVIPEFYNLSNSRVAPLSSQRISERRIFGALGNVRIGYDNALFLEYSARNDWSSTLPPENNSFFYNAIGLSAVLTDLLKVESNILSFGKVRASYGTSGKDADPYLLQSVFVGNPTLAGLGDFAINFPLNGQAGFTAGNRIGNATLKPELTTTLELGADVGLWNDRFSIAYTYYSSNHTNQIVNISLPRSTGFTSTPSNIGRMTNKGHELTLNFKPIMGLVKDLKWDMFVTYATNKNEVVTISDETDELIVGGPYTPGVSIVASEGLPFGTFKAQAPRTNEQGQILVDPNTGYPLYTDDDVYLGSYQPDYTASLGSNISYKGIGFNILFDVRQGGSFVSQTQFFTEFNGTNKNTTLFNREEYVLPNSLVLNADGSTAPNEVLITEQGYFTNYDPAASTYLVDASFVKLRELGVSYQVPGKYLGKLPVTDVRIAFFGKNIKFWLPEENIYADPEVNGPALTGNASGIETSQVPPARSYGVNLSLKF